MQLALRPVTRFGVTLQAEGTTVSFVGCLDTPRPGEFIQPFIQELNKEILNSHIRSITLDITKLVYLNSAGIREIVDWILCIDSLPENQRYRIHIIYSTKYLWQESSTSTFVFLNTDFISKEGI